MNLESAVKYHFAKSTSISDSPRATSADLLTGTDVMAAIGYCQSKESFGFSAFSGKMEISQNDKVKAVQLLTQYALKHCDKVADFYDSFLPVLCSQHIIVKKTDSWLFEHIL